MEELGSSSDNGVGGIEAVHDVNSVSNSVFPKVEFDSVFKSVLPAVAEAAEVPFRSDVEQVESRSRLEVDPICHGASPTSLI